MLLVLRESDIGLPVHPLLPYDRHDLHTLLLRALHFHAITLHMFATVDKFE